MIEAAKVIVPIGEGKQVEARAIAAGLQAFTELYHEDGLDEVLVSAEKEGHLFEERLLVQAIGQKLSEKSHKRAKRLTIRRLIAA